MPDILAGNISVINFILINVALGLSIYFTLATGLLTLANAGFMAIGAYTTAIVATQAGLPLAVGFLLGIVVAVLVALPFGWLVLRLREVYLAIATLGFGEIIRIVALNGDKLVRLVSGDPNAEVFRGAEGITLAYSAPQIVLGLPGSTWPVLLYVLALAYLTSTLQRSRYGRIMAAIRLDDSAAATLGINVFRYKLLFFVLGAGVAAGAGSLSAPLLRVIDPRNYVFARAVEILAFAVLGGMTNWVGPIVGAMVLTGLPEALRFLREQREVVNGVIIMLSIIYLPRGLADPILWRGLWARLWPSPAIRTRTAGPQTETKS